MFIKREPFSCILVFLLVHLQCFLGDQARNGACRGDNRDEFGFALLGHHYATFSADNFGRCFFLCFEERCQSVTYLWDGKECQLNKETKTSRPLDFVPLPAASYMENGFRAKKGSIVLVPGLSCKDILVSGDAHGDGEYWIDPTTSGDPFKVLCDMTTGEGKNIWCTGINPSNRKDCGWGGITAEECEAKGCCFDNSIQNVIWCFKRKAE